MDPVGISLGVAGLAGIFSICLDVIERWDSYKDCGHESAILAARFVADSVRFQQWGQSVGLAKGRHEDEHHRALDDPMIQSTVNQILRSIALIDGDAGDFESSLRHLAGPVDSLAESRSVISKGRSQLEKIQGAMSRKGKLGWALRGKARFLALVEGFDALVQLLYDLVPPDPSSLAGQKVPKTGSWDSDSINVAIQKLLADVEKQVHDEVQSGLNKWLGVQDTTSMYDNSVRKRLDGTCGWIFDRSEFKHWQSSPSEKAKLLWVHGPPGYGKTVICARIIQYLEEHHQNPLAYFFFSSDLESRADPFAITRSWIFRIASQNREAFDLAQVRRAAADGHKASQTDIEEILKSITQKIPGCTFIIDGLDECMMRDDNMTGPRNPILEFLKSLKRSISKSDSRLLIVSRNDPEVREGLYGTKDSLEWELAELQIIPKDVESDATLFSQSIVEEKLANKPEAQRRELTNRIVDRHKSMFLAIKLLEPDLRGGKNLKQLHRAIDEAPEKLDRIYDRNWDKIRNLDDFSRLRAFWILRWATFSSRPLTIFEITEALLLAGDECEPLDYTELPDSVDETYIKTEVLELCGSLIEVRGHESSPDLGHLTIHLSHFSVRQYILSHLPTKLGELIANESLRSSNEAIQNSILAKVCIRYLDCDKVWENPPQSDERNTMVQAFRAYAASSWYKHAQIGIPHSEDLVQQINHFFNPQNQTWQSWRKHSEHTILDWRLVYIRDPEFGNPLFYAALLGFSKTIDHLIDVVGLPVDHVDTYGRTALLGACLTGWTLGVKQLLHKGANPNFARDSEMTPSAISGLNGVYISFPSCIDSPLSIAVLNGHVEVVKVLLENGANPMAASMLGTSLHAAVFNGHVEIAKLLIENGAHPDAPNQHEESPLHLAAFNNHVEIAWLLLEKGADLTVKTHRGRTPLHAAALNGAIEVAELLLEKGADPTVADGTEEIPLHLAAHGGSTDLVRLLLKNGADPNVTGWQGSTALMLASRKGHVEIVKLLLEKGANPDVADKKGSTPLHSAADAGHAELALLLLERGADLTRMDSDGLTPTDVAVCEGQTEIVELFTRQGADSITADKGLVDDCIPRHLASK